MKLAVRARRDYALAIRAAGIRTSRSDERLHVGQQARGLRRQGASKPAGDRVHDPVSVAVKKDQRPSVGPPAHRKHQSSRD